jgi:hypothetical protein
VFDAHRREIHDPGKMKCGKCSVGVCFCVCFSIGVLGNTHAHISTYVFTLATSPTHIQTHFHTHPHAYLHIYTYATAQAGKQGATCLFITYTKLLHYLLR